MSDDTGPRCTWFMRRGEKRMDVTVAHRDELTVVNTMSSISRNYGAPAVIWAEPYEHAGQIVANGVVSVSPCP